MERVQMRWLVRVRAHGPQRGDGSTISIIVVEERI
jgi:hypothetical protein